MTSVPINILLIETQKVFEKLEPHATTILAKLHKLQNNTTMSKSEQTNLVLDLVSDFTECSHNLSDGEYKFFVEGLSAQPQAQRYNALIVSVTPARTFPDTYMSSQAIAWPLPLPLFKIQHINGSWGDLLMQQSNN